MRLISLVACYLLLLSITGCSGVERLDVTDATNANPSMYGVEQGNSLEEEKGLLRLESTTSQESTDQNITLRENQYSNKDSAIPILYYHSIAVDPGNELRIPPEQFDEQMAYLYEQGYTVITMKELDNYFNSNGSLPLKPIVITFDDGYADNYTNAYATMKKYGFTGTVFMVVSYLDGSGYLTTAQLEEMMADGWELGGHSITHAHLRDLNSVEQKYEVNTSKTILEQKLNHTVNYISYPYGEYSSELVSIAEESGYELGFTTERGWARANQPSMLLPRIYCYTDMGMAEFVRRIENPNY